MKKKAYITPSTCIVACRPVDKLLQAASGVHAEDKDIPYGGIDEDGEQTPGARRHRDVWEEEEEE
jgi:hypothetical protein